VMLCEALLARVFEIDTADATADEALRLATLTGDEWMIAEAAWGKAFAASTILELRERVDRAAALLEAAGNTYQLANLLANAAYKALILGHDPDAKQFADRAAPIVADLGHPYLSMMLHGNSGLAALFTGDPNAARHAFRSELKLCRELVVRPVAAEGLLGLAAVAVVRGDLHRAARLRGAADAQRCGEPTGQAEDRLAAKYFDPARADLGDACWDATMAEGAALNFNEAIAFALAA
jgi:hypothetical protein